MVESIDGVVFKMFEPSTPTSIHSVQAAVAIKQTIKRNTSAFNFITFALLFYGCLLLFGCARDPRVAFRPCLATTSLASHYYKFAIQNTLFLDTQKVIKLSHALTFPSYKSIQFNRPPPPAPTQPPLYPAPLVGELLVGDEALGPAVRRGGLGLLRPLGLRLALAVHGVAA